MDNELHALEAHVFQPKDKNQKPKIIKCDGCPENDPTEAERVDCNNRHFWT